MKELARGVQAWRQDHLGDLVPPRVGGGDGPVGVRKSPSQPDQQAYFLPRWVSVQDYVELCEAEGLRGVRTDDWSARVAPFWTAVLKTAATWRGLRGLLQERGQDGEGAAVMPLMRPGFASGTIKFNLLTCTKPEK